MSKLVNAIKQAAGVIGNDNVFIFLGEVVDNSLAISDGIISVAQITGKVVSSADVDLNYSTNQQKLDQPTQKQNLNNQAGPLVFDNVELQSMPGDTFFIIPKVGSYVRVCYTKYQTPFVIQIQDSDYQHNSVGDTMVNIDSDRHLIQNNDTKYLLTSSEQKFNDGSFGGIMKVEPSVESWNNIEDDINNLKTLWTTIMSSVTAVGSTPLTGAALGAILSSALTTWTTQTLSRTIKTDIENDKITHGE